MRTLKIMDQSGIIFWNGFDYLPNGIKYNERIATEKGIRRVVKDEKNKRTRLLLISCF